MNAIKISLIFYSLFLIITKCCISGKYLSENLKCINENNSNDDSEEKLYCKVEVLNGLNSLIRNLTTVLENGPKNNNFNKQIVNTLSLDCSDKFSSSSFLNKNNENEFDMINVYLQDFKINYCKINSIPSNALESLVNLRSFSLHSYNAEFSTTNLELKSNSFAGLSYLRNLNLAFNNIWNVPSNTFSQINSLKYLNLSNNHISDVAQLTYNTYDDNGSNMNRVISKLEILDLSNNNIINIPNKSFGALTSLLLLRLDSNHLSMLDDGSFDGLISLQHLNLTNNKLIALPPELFNNTKDLRQLYVGHNLISVIAPGLFENLRNLQVLDLSYNELTTAWLNKDTLEGLQELVILKLNNNKLKNLDRFMFQEMSRLQYLSLEANEIEQIAQHTFSDLKHLQELILSHNKLKIIESKYFCELINLNQLLLESNNIQSIHRDAFKNLSNLHDIALNDNLLKEIPSAIKGLHNLKSLDLGKNEIAEIDIDAFDGLTDLLGLRLTDNHITAITKNAFSPLKSLHVLNLASNQIKHIDHSAFTSNPALRAIRLDSNLLEDISSVFESMTSLVLLNVSDNRIKWFDYSYLPQSLEWLDIHINNITEIGDYNDVTNELKIVWMDASNNKIKKINKNLIPKNIEVLNLNNNLIEEIQSGTFLNKKSLRKIYLKGNLIKKLQITSLLMSKISVDREIPSVYLAENPLHCDCSMEWLKNINELSKQRRQHPTLNDLEDVKCTLEHVHGQSDLDAEKKLKDLMSSDFLCKYESHCFPLCQCCNDKEDSENDNEKENNCNCQMTCPDQCNCYHDNTWNRNIVDCGDADLNGVPPKIPNDVTTLYLDGNNIPKLTYNHFIGKSRLEALYLNNSNIEKIAANTFDDMKSLRVLRLNNNKLNNLIGNEFSNQLLLNKLYLNHNQISKIAENTFVHLKYLKVIDLSNNRLIDFDPIKQLASSTLTGALSRVHLDGDNRWNCDCKSLAKLVDWIKYHTENFNLNRMLCTDNRIVGDVLNNCQIIRNFDYTKEIIVENSTPFHSNELNQQQRKVIPFESNYNQEWLVGSGGFISLFAAVLVTIIVIALLIAIICIFRQDIKLLVFEKFGVRLFNCGKRNRRDHCNHPNDHMAGDECFVEKTIDAYLISSSNDRDLLSQIIVPKMQNMGYSVACSNQHYKSLHPHNNHGYLMESFKYGHDNSNKIVILISLNFLQNEWCDNSFRCALQSLIDAENQKNNKIVLILTVPVQLIQMDPILQSLLKKSAVICWGEKRFWSKLRYELPDVPENHLLSNKFSNSIVDSLSNVRYTTAPTTGTMHSTASRVPTSPYNANGWYNSYPVFCSGYSSPLNYKQQYYSNANNVPMQQVPYEYCTPEYSQSPQAVTTSEDQSNENENLHVYSTIPETLSLSGSSDSASITIHEGEL